MRSLCFRFLLSLFRALFLRSTNSSVGLAIAGLTILSFNFCSSAAQAGEVTDFTIHHGYESVRALGMGDAFTALADDYSALFYNPAGLARIEKGQVNLGIGAGVDTKFYPLYNDIKTTSSSNNVSDMTNLLAQDYGNHYSARLPLLNAFWVRPGWGLAIIPVDLSLDLEIHNVVGPAIGLIATQDTTIAYGRGWDLHWLGQDRLSIGFTGKAIYRGYYNKLLLAADLALNNTLLRPSDAQEGLTVDADAGMLWTPKLSARSWLRYTRPTFGWTVHNIGAFGYIGDYHLIDPGTTTPPPLVRSLDVGTAWELPNWWIWKTRFMADLRDIGNDNFTLQKGMHLGAEFLWNVRSWWQGGWRIGVNQGYLTAGVSGTLGIFTLDIATYGEEEGTASDPKANRIYMAKASLDF
jgi:hypothetical protein